MSYISQNDRLDLRTYRPLAKNAKKLSKIFRSIFCNADPSGALLLLLLSFSKDLLLPVAKHGHFASFFGIWINYRPLSLTVVPAQKDHVLFLCLR